MKSKQEYLNKGYSIVYRDKEYITLERPKRFSIATFIFLGFFTGGLGFIVYPLYYIGKSNDKVTIKNG